MNDEKSLISYWNCYNICIIPQWIWLSFGFSILTLPTSYIHFINRRFWVLRILTSWSSSSSASSSASSSSSSSLSSSSLSSSSLPSRTSSEAALRSSRRWSLPRSASARLPSKRTQPFSSQINKRITILIFFRNVLFFDQKSLLFPSVGLI